MYQPLADFSRPNRFEDVLGNKRVISILQKMTETKKMVSVILYGPTGVGKTTLANIIADHFPLNHFKFNASTDSKAVLKQIVETVKLYDNVLLIIDEIHRMNRDIQDYLLPYVEKGNIVMIGLTTENPYIAVNPAVRSRTSIFRIERPETKDIEGFLRKLDLSNYDKKFQISDSVYETISVACNGEVRSAINMLELLLLTSEDGIIDNKALEERLPEASKSTFKTGDNYYDILSAFHKSVRGSDANAALHYLARLLAAGDLESLVRRIRAIVYEDIGLANPMMGVKVDAACNTAVKVGMPEARNALGAITIEMCLSPKSNSAHIAIEQALADVNSGLTFKVPSHLINNPTYDDKQPYKYAHDYENHIVSQQYLPIKLKDKLYYVPQRHTKLENIFADEYEKIQAILRSKS
ncbi:MAG: replication-associated recombination protein A [Bacilli bacterium]|nr:replication-associated recombination protein A [Bacilli bacterium]MBN2876069.1 replication-associated recombination protein A [Bacilli bacterium]